MWRRRASILTMAALLVTCGLSNALCGDETERPKDDKNPAAVKSKAIAEQTRKGLAYLVSQQQQNGGWGQGGGWRSASQGRVEGDNVQDPPDVGNTAIATLALIRAGNTPKSGEYAKNVA